MEETLILSDAWRERLEGPLLERNLACRWEEASPLPGGRGTARRVRILGSGFVLKREARGGLSRLLLPDRFLCRTPFRREWADANLAAGEGLCPRPAARSYRPVGPLFVVYTLLEEVTEGHTLLDSLAVGDPPPWEAAGNALARLHRLGLVHGDLNAGNVLACPAGAILFLDFRHSRREGPPASARSRRNNLNRLSRSVFKETWRRGLPFPKAFSGLLADGYAEGWGHREDWLRVWADGPPLPGFLRRALWTRF